MSEASQTRRDRGRKRRDQSHWVTGWLFGVFGLMLLSNVVLSWYLQRLDGGLDVEAMVFKGATALTITELVDTVLVLVVFVVCGKEIPTPTGMGRRKRLGVGLGVPMLTVLLLANFGYHHLVLQLAGMRPEADELLASGYYRWWLLILVCVQPAVIEELFFRRLTFDFFCEATSPGTAAFTSAIMFAAVHTGGFISLPYLVLIGFSFAWLRWFTGSLALPMVLHFVHNVLTSVYELAVS